MDKATEICSWFMKEGDLLVAVNSFFRQKPSSHNIYSMEDSLVYYIGYNDLEYIYRHFHSFNRNGRILTQNYYCLSEDRQIALSKPKAADRYKYLLETQPDLIQRIPSTYIASYLGMSLETLSRLKRRIQG